MSVSLASTSGVFGTKGRNIPTVYITATGGNLSPLYFTGDGTEGTIAGQLYKVHRYTTNGTFTITSGPPGPTIDYFVLGGGGGSTGETVCAAGGAVCNSAAAGGSGYSNITLRSLRTQGQAYPVTVGGAGVGTGGSSSFDTTSVGGGVGGQIVNKGSCGYNYIGCAGCNNGQQGGSCPGGPSFTSKFTGTSVTYATNASGQYGAGAAGGGGGNRSGVQGVVYVRYPVKDLNG